ncbi:hypothetical protein Nwi_1623 [Nitrobacter winogradskyi Nb-255]|uniref:Uncharacterized protein n=2 Tax=Nitrobacter winogradskyi TaxID=913 RepID=Q3SS57_NITWN|nr:hypothetical protein Nwi_1623 [Nitrobacter winogradskyi Nb-255]
MTMQNDEKHDRQLWCAVLGQAITDATTTRTGKDAQRDQHAAIQWLLTDTIDFPIVCTLAGVDPEAVRERFMRTPGVVEKFQGTQRDRRGSRTHDLTELGFFPR